MDKIKNVIVYIDNLHEQYLQSLEEDMQRLEENNMKINQSNCFFRNTEVSNLVFRLTATGIKPGKHSVKAVEMAKIPQTNEVILGLYNFLGLTSRILPESVNH